MAVARRPRRQPRGATPVEELKGLVDSLIKENQRLKQQLARMETKALGSGATLETRGLAAIARRLERALGAPANGRRRSSGSTNERTRGSNANVAKARKPSSPETQAKRIAALARARDARAAKRAARS
jgi:hypothetical protein